MDFALKKEIPAIALISPHTYSKDSDLTDILKCPSCGEQMTPFLSFPGSYEKEKEMREILQILWKYLAYKIGSVTIVGVSGNWDPLIIAFLGDLLSERNVPLLVVEKEELNTHLIKELIEPQSHLAFAMKRSANDFLEDLTISTTNPVENVLFNKIGPEDHYWSSLLNEQDDLNHFVNSKFSNFELKLLALDEINKLGGSAQLGLKSQWLDSSKSEHNRLYHSLGVMKIASFLYDKAIENSHKKENSGEKQFLRIAALLHDIGHLPFSHLIEEVFEELNWKPKGYRDSYSHVLYTEDKINKIFKDSELQDDLNHIGYDTKDLIKLINGNFGVSYLDAIINSAIDADKIDYVFRDTHETKTTIQLSAKQFLEDIINGLKITPEGFLSFSGISARAAYNLLHTRFYLYNELYQPPSFRILDGITKHIITSYFLHNLDLSSSEFHNPSEFENVEEDYYPDLGYSKILFSIDSLVNIASTYQHDKNKSIELFVLEKMFESLMNNLLLNEEYKKGLRLGFKKIVDVNRSGLKKFEVDVRIQNFDEPVLFEKISKIAKTCKLRMPGALVIDVVKNKKFLSIADERKQRLRSDDTKTFSECIIVPAGKGENWYSYSKASIGLLDSEVQKEGKKGFTVYIYPLSDVTPYVRQAENLFEKLMAQEEIPFEFNNYD